VNNGVDLQVAQSTGSILTILWPHNKKCLGFTFHNLLQLFHITFQFTCLYSQAVINYTIYKHFGLVDIGHSRIEANRNSTQRVKTLQHHHPHTSMGFLSMISV
jgi:hypothetical protein